VRPPREALTRALRVRHGLSLSLARDSF